MTRLWLPRRAASPSLRLVRKLLEEFRTFAFSGNLLDVAIGIAIGAAFAAVVDSLVKNLLLPLVAAVFGQPDVSRFHVRIGRGDVRYGSFVTDLLSFLLLAFVVLVLVKAIKRLTGKEAVGAQGNRECDHCRSFVPVDASVCMYCTRDIVPLVA